MREEGLGRANFGHRLVLHIKGRGIVLASARIYALLFSLKHMIDSQRHSLFDRSVKHRNHCKCKCNDNQ